MQKNKENRTNKAIGDLNPARRRRPSRIDLLDPRPPPDRCPAPPPPPPPLPRSCPGGNDRGGCRSPGAADNDAAGRPRKGDGRWTSSSEAATEARDKRRMCRRGRHSLHRSLGHRRRARRRRRLSRWGLSPHRHRSLRRHDGGSGPWQRAVAVVAGV